MGEKDSVENLSVDEAQSQNSQDDASLTPPCSPVKIVKPLSAEATTTSGDQTTTTVAVNMAAAQRAGASRRSSGQSDIRSLATSRSAGLEEASEMDSFQRQAPATSTSFQW